MFHRILLSDRHDFFSAKCNIKNPFFYIKKMIEWQSINVTHLLMQAVNTKCDVENDT